MPSLAAWMVCTAFDMESRRSLKSEARPSRPAAVKKLFGLSSAELTFLPVARRFWVRVIRSAVACNDRRFCRTPAVRTISDIGTYSLPRRWSYSRTPVLEVGRDLTPERLMAGYA